MESKLSCGVSRREFLKYAAALSASAAAAGLFPACAVDPVTGEKELVMVSRQQEIEIDRNHAAFQFSSDYGITRDSRLNRYVSRVGEKLLPHVHRPCGRLYQHHPALLGVSYRGLAPVTTVNG